MHLCLFPYLQILDLSLNNLSGSIPSCLGNLKALKDMGTLLKSPPSTRQSFFYQAVDLVVKGRQNECTKIIPIVNIIDFSSNSLTGETRNEMTNLSALGSLNLSRNHLTGRIPENIGRLQQWKLLTSQATIFQVQFLQACLQ